MDPVASRHPESDDVLGPGSPTSSLAGTGRPRRDRRPRQPADAGSAPRRSPSPSSRSWPVGAVPVRLHAGPPGRHRAGHRRPRTRPRSSRSGTPTTRSASGTRAARSTATTLVQGAIRGMIEALGDPFSAYLTSDEYRQSLRASAASSRASAPRSPSQAADGTQGCAPLGTDVPPRGHRADRRLAGREGRPARRRRRPGDRRRRARRPDGRRGARQDPRARRAPSSPSTIQRGSATPGRARHHPRRRPDQRGRAARTSPTGRSATSGSPASPTRRPTRSSTALEAHVAAGRTKLILDLRGNPGGFVTAARKIASQFIGVRRRLLGAGRGGQPGRRPTRSAGGVATDPTIRARRASSTAAARRPARSSPARSRTPGGRRSSASSRTARAPSSSGRSSPATAARSG